MGVREQVMRKQHRLRRLQVSLARHHRIGVRPCLTDQCVHHIENSRRHHPHGVAQPHPKEGGHLVVPRSPCAQTATDLRADPLDQTAFERTVDVFVAVRGCELARPDIVGQPRESVLHGLQVVVRQQPSAV